LILEKILKKDDRMTEFERLFPEIAEWSTIKLTCGAGDYSASVISRAVEDCDAHVLNLNVTAERMDGTNDVVVELRVSHANAMSVARSLERYGYTVLSTDSSSENLVDEIAEGRLEELMRYLQI